ncbi:MAG TPA: hypothetical protein VNT58_12100 [Gaiellaceae bacterium]|nr:hypothetical protein [Gaiellaceae bacterium]
MSRRVLRLVGGERGMALPMALAVMVATGAMLVTIVEYSSSSGRTANVAKAQVSARSLAEAGLANAFAVLNYWDEATLQNNAYDPTLLGCDSSGSSCTPIVSTYEGGTATWYGVLNSNTSTWTITSTGEVTNPTSGQPLRKTLRATVAVTWNTTQPANAAAWNYVYSTKTNTAGSCEFTLDANNVVIDVPVYVKGDLCFTNNGGYIDEQGEGQNPAPQPIDVRVGGRAVFTAANASIGVSSDPITSAAIAGGCASSVSATATPCTGAPWNTTRYFVGTTGTFQSITEPTADFAGYFSSASPGPNHDCVTATNPANLAPSTFDTDNVQDGNDGTFDLTPATSYQCKTYVGGATGGTQVGELSWNAVTKVLTVKGVIFIDGNVTSSSTLASYEGSATLYVGGSFTFSGNDARLCANALCDFTTWNPNTEMLVIASNGGGSAFHFANNNHKFQGGIFCNPNSQVTISGTNATLMGPIICGTITFKNNAILKPLPAISELPLGAPANPNVHAEPATPVYEG